MNDEFAGTINEQFEELPKEQFSSESNSFPFKFFKGFLIVALICFVAFGVYFLFSINSEKLKSEVNQVVSPEFNATINNQVDIKNDYQMPINNNIQNNITIIFPDNLTIKILNNT